MGYSSWSHDDWGTYSSTTSSAAPGVHSIYKAKSMPPEADPKGVIVRESRDSDINPQSTAISVFLDVTGSMGSLADQIARKGLGVLMEEILARKPVTDPHALFGFIGDVECDQYPLQITQFEPDIKIAEQLEKMMVEGGGGGNQFESYALAWYWAANHTAIDCFEKRGKKGYLFTVGDEPPTPQISAAKIRQFIGDECSENLTGAQMLAMAERMYHVFHIIVEQGSHARHYPNQTSKAWREVLGQRVIPLADVNNLAEVIVSTIEVTEGRDKAEVAASWSGSTAIVVAKAIDALVAAPNGGVGGGVVRF